MLVFIFRFNVKVLRGVDSTGNRLCLFERLCCMMEMRLKIVEAFAEHDLYLGGSSK